MKAQTSMDNLDQYGYNTTQKARPTDPQYAMGAVPGECIPAKWWNWFFNLSIKTLMADRADTSTIIAEINNVLTEAGITPDPSATNQFASALINIKNTVGVANGLAPGYVKSSTANGEVSVNPTTGVMTGNGVGDINTITLPPNVEADVISVMNYFIVQIFGYGPVLPPNPFPAITQGSVTYFETHDLAGAGGRVPYIFCGNAIPTASEAGKVTADEIKGFTSTFTLEGGHWYRIVMSGGGGGGGGGSANAGNRSVRGAPNTTVTHTSSIAKGKNGAMGSPGALSVFDIYLAEDELCYALIGKGGYGGEGGKRASVAGSTNTTATPSGGGAGAVYFFPWNNDASRHILYCTHINATSSGNNGSGTKYTYTSVSYGSDESVSGGNGADGGNGSGAILMIGNRMYSVSGGRGGKGNYTSGTRPRDYPDSTDQYINKFAYNSTLPAALAAVQKAPDIYDTSGGLGAWTPVSKNTMRVDEISRTSFTGSNTTYPLITLGGVNVYEENGTTKYGQFYVHLVYSSSDASTYGNKGGSGASFSQSSTTETGNTYPKYTAWSSNLGAGTDGETGYPGFIMIYKDDYTV